MLEELRQIVVWIFFWELWYMVRPKVYERIRTWLKNLKSRMPRLRR